MEETKRTIHRYGLLLKRLGLSAVELDGKTPEESERVFEDALTELRSRRTEAEILYASGAAVRLAGRDYEIKPLPIDRDLAWRQACARVAQDVMDVVFEMADTGKDAPAVVAARQRLYEAEYAKDEAAIAAAEEALGKALEVYDRALAGEDFVVPGGLSLADISLAPYVAALPMLEASHLVAGLKNVASWWERIAARPGWKAAVA